MCDFCSPLLETSYKPVLDLFLCYSLLSSPGLFSELMCHLTNKNQDKILGNNLSSLFDS